MKLDIIFENNLLLVVDKPSGVVVNNSITASGDTLQNQISKYLKLAEGDLGVGGRVGIVHRLDKEGSGLMVASRTQQFEAAQKTIDEQKGLIDLGITGMESRDVEIVELKEAESAAWFKGGAYGAVLGIVLTIWAIIML